MRRTLPLLLCLLAAGAAAPAAWAQHPPGQYGHRDSRRVDTLALAARELAIGARSLRRSAELQLTGGGYPHGHPRYDPRYRPHRLDRGERRALDALYRLDGQSGRFAVLVADRRHRPESIDRAYAELVRDFRIAWQLLPAMRPHGSTLAEIRRLEVLLARVDRRYFGSWAFRDGDPDWRGRREHQPDDGYDRERDDDYDPRDRYDDRRGTDDDHDDDYDDDYDDRYEDDDPGGR
jgi:hypothetical protein